MARAQTGLEQLLAQSRQQIESTIFEEQFILHPHCESRMSLLCTFKIITKSRCFNGSGAARRPYHGAKQIPRARENLAIAAGRHALFPEAGSGGKAQIS